MKKLFSLLLSCYCMVAMGQNLINPVVITLPANPPASTAAWATVMPPFTITAQAKLQNGRVPAAVAESRILVTVKQGGGTVCGSYTPQTAPASNFNAASKTWTSAGIMQLLGKDCVLKPGSYELCVQFYGIGPAANTLLGESCKAFTIADTKQDSYSPPQNVMPAADKNFTEQDTKGGINFRWTPVLPRPKENVTYRLKVWQLMQGQNGTQAMRSNQPIVTKDVDNITQATINNLYTGPCRPPYLCDFIWSVEALSKGQGVGEKSLGSSEPTAFKIIVTDPSTGCFSLDTTQYKVVCSGFDQTGKPVYHISNLILKNIGTNPGRTGLHNTPATNYITPTAFTVNNLTPPSATGILPGNNISIGFDIVGATGTTASFVVNSTIPDPTNPNLYCDKTIGVTVDLPDCKCEDCKDAQLTVNNPSVNLTNAATGAYTATGSLNITGVAAIYGIEMQVQSYSYTAVPSACSNGVTAVENSGVFNLAGTTINGSSVAMLNETVSGLPSTNNGVAKNIKLISTTALPASMPINLVLGLPTSLPGLNANCCKITYTVCIKIRVFYDKDRCNSCSFQYCFPAFTN